MCACVRACSWVGIGTRGSQRLKGQVMTNKINVSPISRLVHWPLLCSHTHTHVIKNTHTRLPDSFFSQERVHMGTRGGWECRATLGRHLLSFSLLSHKSEGQLYLKNLILSITTYVF